MPEFFYEKLILFANLVTPKSTLSLKFITSIFFIIFLSASSFCQDLVFKVRRLEVEKDALANNIRDMARDRRGFVWLATRNGLHRYDGNMFEHFRGQGGTLKLVKNQLNCCFSQNDKLYLGGQQGIQVVNTNTYIPEPLNAKAKSILAVIDIYADENGGVYWLSEDGSVNALKADGRVLTGASFIAESNYKSIIGQGEELYLLGDSAMLIVDKNDMSVKKSVSLPYSENVDAPRFVRINSRSIIFISGTKLFEFDRASMRISVLMEFKSVINQIEFTPKGVFTIENGNTVYHYDSLTTGAVRTKIDMQFDYPVYYSGLSFLNDQLLLSSTNGFFIIDVKPGNFRTILSAYDSADNSFYDPRGIAETNDEIYLFSFPKVQIFNKASGRIRTMYGGRKIAAHSVYAEKDTFWVGSEGSGLIKFLPRTGTWESILQENGKKISGIAAISFWTDRRLLMGSYNGVFSYARGDNKVVPILLDLPGWKTLQPFTEDIIGLADGGFVLATTRGIYRIGADLKLSVIYETEDGNPLSGQGHALLLMPGGYLWVGTSNGLFCYSISGRLIRHLSRSNGLAGDRIASLLTDKAGNIWVGTFEGLSCIQASTGKISNYFSDEGLPGSEFNHASAKLLSNGDIIMGVTKGFLRFNPAECLQEEKYYSKARLSKIEYGTDNRISEEFRPDVLNKDEILLGKEIKFAKLYFRGDEGVFPEYVDFDYMVEGVHSSWQRIRREDYLQLIDLSPGRYKLKVRMIVDEIAINNSELEYQLVVREYFYRTMWFYVLIAVIFSLLAFIYLRSLLQRERKIRELRLLVSRNLHDEVGSYLTGISMNVDMIRKKTSGINEYQQSISDLSRKALAALKDGLWSLDRDSDNGQYFWDRVKVIAKETFEPLEIDFSINAPKDLDRIHFTVIQKNQLIYVIKECFTNAMKYGKGNSVSVNWEVLAGKHRIVIRNRKAEEISGTGTLQGIDNIRFRMSEIGGSAVAEQTSQEFSVTLHLDFIK